MDWYSDDIPFIFLYHSCMKEMIRQKLIAELNPILLDVIDESHKHAGHAGSRPGGNTHFRITIVSQAFHDLSKVQRHRKVHDILKEELATTLHALSLNLKSPHDA